MTNQRGYPFACEAVFSLSQRGTSGKVEILHSLAVAGINVRLFSTDIRAQIARLLFHTTGIASLPRSVEQAQVNEILGKIIHRRIAPRHWPQWVTRRAEILLRADALIKQTGRAADREKILLSLLATRTSGLRQTIEKFAVTK